jgi:DNA-binding phage protein
MDNKLEGYLDEAIKKYEIDPEFIAEGMALKVTEEMLAILEKQGKNQTWLAQEMGVSRAHISKILNARPNMTLLTVAKIAVALGTKPEISIGSPAPHVVSKPKA